MRTSATQRALLVLLATGGILQHLVLAQVTLGTSPYTQNFNGVGSGLPTGWTVRTGATASALGTAASFTNTATQWSSIGSGFSNAASATGSTGAESSAVQAASTNRVPSVRQTGAVGDPGAAWVLQVANTLGKENFQLAFKLQQLHATTTDRTVTWTVDYGFGATPSSFTPAATVPAVLQTTQGVFSNVDVTVNFGSALNNQTGPVWIRVVALTGSTGSGSRPRTAIDDFQLSWTDPVGSNTSVQFASATGSVNESAASVNLPLAITNPSTTNPTSVTIAAAGATGRITTFTTPVNFPANSGSDQPCTVTIANNMLCDGDEDVVFSITGISGGQGTPVVGFQSSSTLTVVDDDLLVAPVATDGTAIGADSFTANWNAVPIATGYELDVSTLPGFGVPGGVLVEWNFPNNPDNAVADGGIAANATRTISTVGANAPTFDVQGATTNAATATGWNSGTGTKWWQVDLSTEGYTGITVSSKQRSSASGPRDFQLEYRIGVLGTWTPVAGGTVLVADNFTSGVLTAVPLPAACDDQPQLFLRWIMTSNTNTGGVGSVTTLGTSRIDDIVVSAAFQPSFVPGYEALPVAGLSQAVTGLDPATTYYYRVRATGGGCDDSGNSNVIAVTTGLSCTADLFFVHNNTTNYQDLVWTIHDQTNDAVVETGGINPGEGSVPLCLPDGCFYLRVTNSGGNTIAGGYRLILKNAVGAYGNARIIDDTDNLVLGPGGDSGISGNEGFCIPLGTDEPIYTSCDRYWWKSGDYLVGSENLTVSAEFGGPNAGNSGYEFWFYDPNGGLSFRKTRVHTVSDGFAPNNAVRACHIKLNNWAAASHLQNGVLYNVRSRGVVAGNPLSEYGPACRVTLDPVLAACPPTGLNDIPGNPNFSCGVDRIWGGPNQLANRIFCRPVAGANLYEWEFTNDPNEPAYSAVLQTTGVQRHLNWNSQDPMQTGRTYNVRVRASKNGGLTWCEWGWACQVTIVPSAAPGNENMALEGDAASDLALWPNPNNGQQVWIALNDVSTATVAIDIFDLRGQRVMAREIATQGGELYTNIDLGGLAAGTYLVTITAGDEQHMRRLVVQP
ncbi:MAG: T9SS type A sorting domain-containing protein [Flavobacteriales bacterium]|nr:T9SS type A sorting domain-containing protein [Flavobacteriales bacterium]